jgi:hypothetical protein
MITADGARLQNEQTVERLVKEDYQIALKMINGLIMSGIDRKQICNSVEIDLKKKEAKIICGHVMAMLQEYYEKLGYKFDSLYEKHPEGKSVLTISWRK